MSDENGNGLHISTTLKAVRDAVADHDERVLPDMRDGMNGIRSFLVGGIRPDGIWPAGILRTCLDGQELRMTLSIYSLEIEADYRGDSFHGLLETVNNDLELNTVRWKLNYSGQERRKRKMLQES